MRSYQVEGREVADALVEFRRAAQVGEEESKAGDLQPLVHIERVGAVDVAESLVGEQPLGGEKWPTATAATRTEHIPGKLENAQARRMQKACDRLFLVEALARGKGERIDPAKPVIGCIPNEPLECIGDLRPCRMAQHIEKGLGFAHEHILYGNRLAVRPHFGLGAM